jgi:hypothetical protein
MNTMYSKIIKQLKVEPDNKPLLGKGDAEIKELEQRSISDLLNMNKTIEGSCLVLAGNGIHRKCCKENC